MSLADASSCLVAHLQRVAADLQTIEHAVEAEFRRRYAGEVSRQWPPTPTPLRCPPPPRARSSLWGTLLACLLFCSRYMQHYEHVTSQVDPMDLLHKLRKLKRCAHTAHQRLPSCAYGRQRTFSRVAMHARHLARMPWHNMHDLLQSERTGTCQTYRGTANQCLQQSR